MKRPVYFLTVKLNVEILKKLLLELKGCLNKASPYRQLLVYKEDSDETFLLSDKDILYPCNNEKIAPYFYWGNQEHIDWLFNNFAEFKYEGDVRLLGYNEGEGGSLYGTANLN